MKIRNLALWAVALSVLIFVNYLVFQREKLAATGKVVLLELAPVDPRSLIQGDYMQLRYALSQEVENHADTGRGFVVVRLDENNVAHYVKIYAPTTALAEDEVLLPYRREAFDVRVGPKSFFFQEGHAEYYEEAKYGELRVSDSGAVLLIGLRDENLRPLGPPR